jgi:hypothetical protein
MISTPAPKTPYDDMVNACVIFSGDPKPNTRRAYSSASTRREIDEVDSGLGSGSSQASSPATSSVSSVDTTTDDLIDFTSRTSTFPRSAKGRGGSWLILLFPVNCETTVF